MILLVILSFFTTDTIRGCVATYKRVKARKKTGEHCLFKGQLS